MKFDDLDTKMRCYEQSIDQHVLSDMYLVARLDGRSFSRLTLGTRKRGVFFWVCWNLTLSRWKREKR